MPLSNKERQKRWREKNRVIYNLRRRNKRKGVKEGASTPIEPVNTIEGLRALVATVSAEPGKPTSPRIYRNDFGNVITEDQWNQLQKIKEDAAAGGYIPEY